MVSVFVQGVASAYNVIYAKRRAAGKSRRAEHSRNRGKSVKPRWLSVRTVNASGSVASTFWTNQCGTTIGNGRKSRPSLVSILYLSNIGTSSHRTAFLRKLCQPQSAIKNAHGADPFYVGPVPNVARPDWHPCNAMRKCTPLSQQVCLQQTSPKAI